MYLHTLSLYSSLVCQTDQKFNCTTDNDCNKTSSSNKGNGEFVLFLKLTSLSGLLILITSARNYVAEKHAKTF